MENKLSMQDNEEKSPKRCHWGNTFAFQWNNVKFFGAGSFRGLSMSNMDVIIDCGANVQQDSEIHGAGKAAVAIRRPRIIRIKWPDGGKPALTEKNWHGLIRDLHETSSLYGKESLHVLVCCVGGHGRTGTALAVIAALTGVATANPVEFIRKGYCRKAVETKLQCGYVKAMARLARKNGLSQSEFDSYCASSIL